MRLDSHIAKALAVLTLAAAMPLAALAQSAPSTSAQKPAAQKSSGAQTFATPEEAANALAEAVRAKDRGRLLAIVGPGSDSWLLSGDEVSDRNDWTRFLEAYDRKHAIETADGKVTLVVGDDGWPFPAPIVKRGDKWAFDANAGREEIVNRRVGRNELDAIQTLLAIVDAQLEYAASDADGNGYADYAKRFRSSPGKKDGLYWATQGSEPPSPLGPLVAVAAREGYGKSKAPKEGERQAYHGYYYKILTAQGKDAPGGAYDYMVGDKLLGGFAVVAWPATYRVSGVATLLVNHDGIVYEKDLGPQTASIASNMTRFNPDATWRKAQ